LGEAKFVTSTFVKETDYGPDRLRIFWTFADAKDDWQGPVQSAQMAFGGKDAVYKIYLMCGFGEGEEAPDASPAVEFAKEFMPVVNEKLFSAKFQEPEETEDTAPE